MKREEIKFGDKLVCEGVVGLVEVLDIDLPEDELVAILLPNQHTYFVPASQLSKPTDVCDEDYDEYFFEFEDEATPKPTRVDIRYDEATMALFIIFEEKVTVCVPEVTPDVAKKVAMSFCKDGEVYDEEVGCALAYFRTF